MNINKNNKRVSKYYLSACIDWYHYYNNILLVYTTACIDWYHYITTYTTGKKTYDVSIPHQMLFSVNIKQNHWHANIYIADKLFKYSKV